MDIADLTYDLVEFLPRDERFGLRSQITRAATSVPANFAEGWTRETKRDKAYFIAVMHGSLSELKTHLQICERRKWLDAETLAPHYERINELSRMLGSLRKRWREELRAGNLEMGTRRRGEMKGEK